MTIELCKKKGKHNNYKPEGHGPSITNKWYEVLSNKYKLKLGRLSKQRSIVENILLKLISEYTRYKHSWNIVL